MDMEVHGWVGVGWGGRGVKSPHLVSVTLQCCCRGHTSVCIIVNIYCNGSRPAAGFLIWHLKRMMYSSCMFSHCKRTESVSW